MKKSVYIMGAGTSAEAGAPLMDDFFPCAIDIKKQLEHNEVQRFENILNFRSNTLPESNIEDLFSFIEMRLSINPGQYLHGLKNDLVYLIGKILDMKLSGTDFPIHKKFMEALTHRPEVKSIISLNYDILFDIFYQNINVINRADPSKMGVDYGCTYNILESGKCIIPGDRLKILKLHGSLNWLYCREDNKLFSTKGKILHHAYEGEKFNCPACGKLLETLLIPPSLMKLTSIADNSPIGHIWDDANSEIRDAEKLVIIGYSFPETDTHFKLFLLGSLNENIRKREDKIEINVITRRKHGSKRVEFENKYSRIFCNDMMKINFVYKDFREYVDDFITGQI